VVVHHDAVPKQDEGPAPLRPFAMSTLAEVRHLRVSGREPVPTLPEVLDLVRGRMTVYCELKGEGGVELAAPILARYSGPCAMHSFDHRAARRAADLAPNVPRGVLVVSRLVDSTHALRAAKATALWPETEFIDADLVAEIHAMGGTIIAWTADDPVEINRLTALGVDGLCSNDVTATRAARDATFPALRA
jgi:glycerophosphoryl diester phosphodiesterase